MNIAFASAPQKNPYSTRMGYCEIKPTPPLQRFVECFWTLEQTTAPIPKNFDHFPQIP